MKNLLLLILTLSTLATTNREVASIKDISKDLRSIRDDHAKELFGRRYKRSIASLDEEHVDIEEIVFRTVKKSLPKKFRHQAKLVAHEIIEQSIEHKFDPIFLMAVILNESSFNPHAKGSSGEIGLMQTLPSTAKWIAQMNNIKWNSKMDLKDPITSIKIGSAYLARLRKKYDNHGRLYLAAYNMGPGNLRRALNKKVWPKDYPIAVMKRYIDIYKKI